MQVWVNIIVVGHNCFYRRRAVSILPGAEGGRPLNQAQRFGAIVLEMELPDWELSSWTILSCGATGLVLSLIHI